MSIFLSLIALFTICLIVYSIAIAILFRNFKNELINEFINSGIPYAQANNLYTLHTEIINQMYFDKKNTKEIVKYVLGNSNVDIAMPKKTNPEFDSAINDTGFNPRDFHNHSAYYTLANLIEERKINAFEAATLLMSQMDKAYYTQKLEITIQEWTTKNHIDKDKMELGMLAISYEKFKRENESFSDLYDRYKSR